MNVYIGGDSFCHFRTDTTKHWPAIVASKLNLNLYGNGFIGMGFWSTRQNLLEYKNSSKFDDTDLFVFCHSEPARTLSTQLSILPNSHVGITSHLPKEEQDNITEIYYKYIYDEDVQTWAYKMWLTELNLLLAGKKVIHLPCFYNSKMLMDDISFGAKLDIPLMDMGIIEILHSRGESYKNFVESRRPIPNKWFDLPANHFSYEMNKQLAQYVVDVYNDMNENTNKVYPILLDVH